MATRCFMPPESCCGKASANFSQTDEFQPLHCLALAFEPARAIDLEPEHDILFDREPGEQRVPLKHHAAIPAGARDRLALQQDLARAVLFEAGENARQRRVAATGRSE